MLRVARHVCQSVMGVFTAMYSLGGQPATYTATSANALTAAAWRQTGASLRAAIREADNAYAEKKAASTK